MTSAEQSQILGAVGTPLGEGNLMIDLNSMFGLALPACKRVLVGALTFVVCPDTCAGFARDVSISFGNAFGVDH